MKTVKIAYRCDYCGEVIDQDNEAVMAVFPGRIGYQDSFVPGSDDKIQHYHDYCMEYVLKPIRYPNLAEILKTAREKVSQRRQNEQVRQYGQQYIDSLAKESRGETANALETAVSYIEDHLADELSVRDIAAACYVSGDHLTRLFKKKYGKAVSEYIQEKRIRLAGELLRRQDMTISMVANTVGFGNYSYFTEQFKKYFGVTPREYQKQAQGQQDAGLAGF